MFLVGPPGFEPGNSDETRFLTTIVFTTIKNVCSLDFLFIFFKILGIKSLHSKIYFLARDCHQHNLLRFPRISPMFILLSLIGAASLGFCFNQRPQSGGFNHSPKDPCVRISPNAFLLYYYICYFVNTFFKTL